MYENMYYTFTMKDVHSNVHLRPYALALLAIAFLVTTGVFIALIIKGEASNWLVTAFSLGIIFIISSASAVAGCSLHDKHYLSWVVRIIAIVTIVSALVSVLVSAIALWDILSSPIIWNMAAISTVFTIISGAFSLLVPLYIGAHANHHLLSIIIIATMVSAVVCFCFTTGYIMQLAFIPQYLYPRLIAATAAPTILGLLLLPIILHWLHIRDHIKGK